LQPAGGRDMACDGVCGRGASGGAECTPPRAQQLPQRIAPGDELACGGGMTGAAVVEFKGRHPQMPLRTVALDRSNKWITCDR